MTPCMRWLVPAALLCVVDIGGVSAQDQEVPIVRTAEGEDDGPGVVTLRAVHPNLPESIVNLVAGSAKPTRFAADRYPELRERSAHQVADQLCGSVNSAYFEAWRQRNKPKVDKLGTEVPLGEIVYDLDWPACLYVNPSKGTYIVADGDNVPRLYKLFTGSDGSKRSWSRFFAGSQLAPGNAVSPGQALTFGWATRAVRLTLTVPKEEFLARYDAALGEMKQESARKLSIVAVNEQPPFGTIPVAVGDPSTDETGRINYTEAPECAGVDQVPFDGARVAATYRFVRDQAGSPLRTGLLVIDNGFFGARAVAGRAQFGPSFQDAAALFASDYPGGIIGPQLKPGIGVVLNPINYENGLTRADQRSGHGTHVLGLALGGPGFDRNLLKGWLKVAVVAVSKGEERIDGTSVSDLITAVTKVQPRVVNISLEYPQENMVELQDMMRTHPDILFVAASGNGYKSVEEQASYPAMLADSQEVPNLLVVGATGGGGNFADFANYSEKKVGTAAPGCRIESWLDESGAEVPMSGTSQAAPLVSFASVLLSSIMHEKAKPAAIRYRIELSGDPLAGEAKTRLGTRMNIEHALYVNYDYISYQPSKSAADLAAPPIELLGELSIAQTWKPCDNANFAQTWSFAGTPTEKGQTNISVITGYQGGATMPPEECTKVAKGAGEGKVRFRAKWRLNGTDKPDPVTDSDFKDIDIALVNRFIRKGPGALPN